MSNIENKNFRMGDKPIEAWSAEEFIEAFKLQFPAQFDFFYRTLDRWNNAMMHVDFNWEMPHEDKWAEECINLDAAGAICIDWEKDNACKIAKSILANYGV